MGNLNDKLKELGLSFLIYQPRWLKELALCELLDCYEEDLDLKEK